tara:strand:- start:218 stop:886 length:669 start_codon:yes stop_codon:yes gene_type:complete
MAVSYQVWEWSNTGSPTFGEPSANRTANGLSMPLTANQEYDIFTGSVGNSMTNPPLVRETQFTVIEELGVTPTQGSNVQIVVNTTAYFKNPDGVVSDGIPATAIPYPCGASVWNETVSPTADPRGTGITLPSFKLDPPLYIMPGQKWTMVYKSTQGVASSSGDGRSGSVGCMIYYMMYDGIDALIANKLVEMALPVNLNNIDWFKQKTLAQNLKSLTMTGGV